MEVVINEQVFKHFYTIDSKTHDNEKPCRYDANGNKLR